MAPCLPCALSCRLYLGNPMDPPDLLGVDLNAARPTQLPGRAKSKRCSPPPPMPAPRFLAVLRGPGHRRAHPFQHAVLSAWPWRTLPCSLHTGSHCLQGLRSAQQAGSSISRAPGRAKPGLPAGVCQDAPCQGWSVPRPPPAPLAPALPLLPFTPFLTPCSLLWHLLSGDLGGQPLLPPGRDVTTHHQGMLVRKGETPLAPLLLKPLKQERCPGLPLPGAVHPQLAPLAHAVGMGARVEAAPLAG